jgi:hypothetical protein
MRKGCEPSLRGDATLGWIGDVGGEVAAVDGDRRPGLKEIVQHVVPFIVADADRPGLAEQLSVHLDGW